MARNSSLGLIEKPPAPVVLEKDVSREICRTHLQNIRRCSKVMMALLSVCSSHSLGQAAAALRALPKHVEPHEHFARRRFR